VQLATYSFPSGHAVASTLFYGTVCVLGLEHLRSPLRRGLATAAAVGMVLLVSFSRVYLGVHYPVDVVAGMALGGACLLVVLPPAKA
jgi:undecaprenyl-diphosphatase